MRVKCFVRSGGPPPSSTTPRRRSPSSPRASRPTSSSSISVSPVMDGDYELGPTSCVRRATPRCASSPSRATAKSRIGDGPRERRHQRTHREARRPRDAPEGPRCRSPRVSVDRVRRSRLRAAMSVFSRRHAIVIGPTPPGTGVIAPARSRASSNATSPTSFVFFASASAGDVDAVHPDVDDDRARLDPVAADELRLADGDDEDVGLAADARRGRSCASARSSPSRARRAGAAPSACRRCSTARRRRRARPASFAPASVDELHRAARRARDEAPGGRTRGARR